MIQRTLYVVSGPSGTGKSNLLQDLLKNQSLYDAKISISHTTREIRPGEKNGEHYYFITEKKFQKMIDNNYFLEYARVFGNYYGTAREVIEENINLGVDVLLDIDWQGVQQIRKNMPSSCTIFILPPSKHELLRRLYGRGQDSEETIHQRMAQAVSEIKHYNEYDYLIINDNFNTALKNLQSIILAERLRLERQIHKKNTVINKLLAD